jgi:hypothetical protein
MAMQATRALEPSDLISGTHAVGRQVDAIREAHRLACEVEQLLAAPVGDDAIEREPYGRKIARAMSRSLIDQLAEISRESLRSKLG